MMFPSHLLGSVLVALLLSRVKKFTPRDWALAIGFGVVIDLDHLLQIPAYIQANGLAALNPGAMSAWGSSWQGFMHDPQTAVWVVGAACIAFRSLIPLAFWGLHMFQDFVIATRFVHFGSPMEWGIIAALATSVGGVLWLEHRGTAPRVAFLRHAAARLGLVALLPAPAAAAEDAPPA